MSTITNSNVCCCLLLFVCCVEKLAVVLLSFSLGRTRKDFQQKFDDAIVVGGMICKFGYKTVVICDQFVINL